MAIKWKDQKLHALANQRTELDVKNNQIILNLSHHITKKLEDLEDKYGVEGMPNMPEYWVYKEIEKLLYDKVN